MPKAFSIQFAMEITGAVFLLLCLGVVLIGNIVTGSYDRIGWKKHAIGSSMMIVVMMLLGDCAGMYFNGSHTLAEASLQRTGFFLEIALIPLLIMAAVQYVINCSAIKPKPVNGRRIKAIFFTASAIFWILLFVLRIRHDLYYYDENNCYQRGSRYWILTASTTIMVVLLAALAVKKRRVIAPYVRVFFMMTLILFFLAGILQNAIPGVNFYNLVFFFCAMLLFLLYEIEKSMRIAVQEELAMEQRLEVSELKNRIAISQLQPHFMFNVMSSIERLCIKDPKRAAEAMHNFAIYMRSDLNTLSQDRLVRFDEEMRLVRSYIWLEQMRFGEDVDFEEEIHAEAFEIPPMSVQPIVENAVKHGMRDDGILHITLKAEELKESYLITISDDGIGFDLNKIREDGRVHVGIENVTARVSSFCEGTVNVESVPGAGTTVTIELPKYKDPILSKSRTDCSTCKE